MKQAITRIHVRGFRSLRDVTLEPGPTTVLIGPNGSGKSNLLSVLKMVPLMRTKSLRKFVGEQGGGSALLHYGAKATPEMTVRLEFAGEENYSAYEAHLHHAAGDSLVFSSEVAQTTGPEGHPRDSVVLGEGHRESLLKENAGRAGEGPARQVDWWLARMGFFHFHDTSASSQLRATTRPEDSRYLRSDGSNLAAYLLALHESDQDSDRAAWERINGLVGRIAPFIKELSPTHAGPLRPRRRRPSDPQSAPTSPSVRLDWIDDRDEVFGPHHLSDGTLRAIALVTALAQPSSRLPRFISIDEPELGLHPAALALLAGLVKSVAHRCQVLLATQSPALLDLFEPEHVVVAERAEGETRVQRLDARKLAGWLEDYTLSELFDKNLLGGRP